MQIYQGKGLLIDKQTSPDLNRLFTMTQDTELLCAEKKHAIRLLVIS